MKFIYSSARASKINQNIKQYGIYTALDLSGDANIQAKLDRWGEGIGTQD